MGGIFDRGETVGQSCFVGGEAVSVKWTGPDGWPVDYPAGLADGIRKIPKCTLSDDEIGSLAKSLVCADDDGRKMDRLNFRPASQDKNEKALIKFHKLCGHLYLLFFCILCLTIESETI